MSSQKYILQAKVRTGNGNVYTWRDVDVSEDLEGLKSLIPDEFKDDFRILDMSVQKDCLDYKSRVYTAFSIKLKQALTEKNMSVLELSKKIGVTTKAIYQYMDGTGCLPKLEMFFRICQTLNVSADYLLGIEVRG